MKRKLWNAKYFSEVNLPEVIGTLLFQQEFSHPRGIRVLDMPIYMPGQGWNIPTNLNPFVEMIQKCVDSEERFGGYEGHYIYITVDQKQVFAGKTGRRAGAHSDAYIEVAGAQIDLTADQRDAITLQAGEVTHTYVAYDCCPTEFFDAKFPLEDCSDEGSLSTFDEIADRSPVVTYPSYTVLRMDSYVVHRCSIVPEDQHRTFVKVSISKQKYARIGNTINPAFNYDWEMTARSPDKRNTPW